MQFFTVLTAALALFMAAPTAMAAPSGLRTVERFQGETSGKYIIQFKTRAARRAWARRLAAATELDIIEGVSAEVDDDTLNQLRASEDVEVVSEDGISHIFATQTNAPWGLGRLSQRARLTNQNTGALTYTYTYDDTAGAGVDIYVLDTGVLTSHSQFGGRARWGISYVGGTTDGHGHGTHCAGTAAGSQFGVAKRANIIAVQVLNASGSGSNTGIISGLNWVLTQSRSSGRPSVVSMSLGGGAATAVDSAVASLTAAGVHVVVAAGNSNTDAASTSPARAPSAITVGASTIADARSSFSNYGAVVDVFGPGTNVISSWIGSNTATNNISGTSMATPHIAGLVAYLIAKDGNISPAAMSTKLKSLALNGVISGIPSGTANELAQNF
ncbi:serine protease [Coprinopsis marcescibilis]|uniref:Serine protease n=1 Tax=Coprinopsis marcescibilis TaxID=230819 RepID=A0A5C3KNN4_COPMA|nr:serine protease [Coprinopsis marcescibilis]